ncbi:hypothetical protein [Haliscomenobacter hydrossis]|uniref:Effector-associated domain-containing protein n=1 Tax=Haliscomenobacter hydrossis (strain ATCC 27775 / DSM 1100 / LMG 10767 / O) TaxID=760192 RepID=F4KQB3_HALH1|nr:hypothetical protein [Haliscomenobacter hydrossis]AEE48939.1 hypothetical protein Halhy_1040 [Haliscomenobacter hydrossis DSM 1100]
MQPKPTTRTQLLQLLEENELEELFQCLKTVCQQLNDSKRLDDLIMCSGRYNSYLHDRDQQLRPTDELSIELNQLKYALLSIVQELPIAEGTVTRGQLREKKRRHFWKQLTMSNWRWSIATGLFSVVILALGQIRISRAEIELQARVSQFGLRTSDEWKIGEGQNLILQRFETDLLKSISCMPETAEDLGAPFSLILEGRSRLDTLFIPGQQTITLIGDHDDLLIRLASGAITGSLYVQNGRVLIQELGVNQKIGDTEGGEMLKFTSDLGATFLLKPEATKSIDLPVVSLDSIGFMRSSFEQDSSTIKDGIVKIGGIETELGLGSKLNFSTIQNGQLRLRQQEGDLYIELSAEVKRARYNQAGRSKSLMPTYLLYLQYNQTYAFYVGIFAALFGFFYPLRKELFSKNP